MEGCKRKKLAVERAPPSHHGGEISGLWRHGGPEAGLGSTCSQARVSLSLACQLSSCRTVAELGSIVSFGTTIGMIRAHFDHQISGETHIRATKDILFLVPSYEEARFYRVLGFARDA
jgi:hypothetical protein